MAEPRVQWGRETVENVRVLQNEVSDIRSALGAIDDRLERIEGTVGSIDREMVAFRASVRTIGGGPPGSSRPSSWPSSGGPWRP